MKNNSQKIRSHLFMRKFTGWLLAGAVIAVMIISPGLFAFDSILYVTVGLIVIAVIVFLVFLVIGVIAGKRAENKLIKAINTNQFDQDTLQPLEKNHKAYLGDNWLVVQDNNNGYHILNKEMIRSADSHMARKEGMKKLWMHLQKTDGSDIYVLYEACQPDVLETVQNWLAPQTSLPEAETAVLPQAEIETVNPEIKPAAEPGTPVVNKRICPHCTGTLDEGDMVCPWCGSAL